VVEATAVPLAVLKLTLTTAVLGWLNEMTKVALPAFSSTVTSSTRRKLPVPVPSLGAMVTVAYGWPMTALTGVDRRT
jgi:hypothetical protein